MGRKKYGVPLVQTRQVAGKTIITKRGRKGRRTAAENQALIYPQAQNVIMKFGGAPELARVLKAFSDNPDDWYHPTSIYRWMYPANKGGTGGEIPTRAIKLIMKAARYAGVMISIDDLYPNIVDPRVQE